MSSRISLSHRLWKPNVLFALLALCLCTGLAAAAVFTMYYSNFTATVRIADVRLAAGPDGSGGSTYPSATVSVASTNDSATVGLSIFPSTSSSPQPATYYTNLLTITNEGSSSHTIRAITVSSLSGESNLGSLTVYYYTSQTESPSTVTATGYATLTSSSSAPVSVFSGSQTIAAAATHYIEVVGYASDVASEDSTVTFTVSIEWA